MSIEEARASQPTGASRPSTATGAVFLSYASEDAASAERIATALRHAGIEVWFDKSELRSGDAWDQKIRRQIRDCALFIPVVSRNTESRTEGYFRLEWHLADQRTQLMARSRPFIVPVCIDDTTERRAEVPESFALVHWSRLPAGETSAAFVERVLGLLVAEQSAADSATRGAPPPPPAGVVAAGGAQTRDEPAGTASVTPRRTRRRAAVVGGIALVTGVMLWFAADRGYFWRNPLANAQFSRLTDWSGAERAAAISRDGRTVAFLADHDGPLDVWVTEMGSGSYRNLTQGNVRDFINPVIRTLGFSADGSLVTIWARTMEGPRTGEINVLAVPRAGGPLRSYLPAAEVAWSSDGKRLVYHTSSPGDPMFVRDSQGGEARRIYVAPPGVHCHFPIWAPDDAFIYFARGVPPDHWDIWRIRPSGADLEQLTFHNSLVTYPVVLDRRTLLYLATDARGSGPWPYAMDLVRRVPHRITLGLERYTSLAASADGSRLAVTVVNPKWALWRVPFSTAPAAETSAQRLSGDSVGGLSPRSGPDYLLYVSRRAGRPGIWKLANGTSRELWSSSPSATVGAPAIGPDGRIAFAVADGNRTLLYVMKSDGAGARSISDSLALRGNIAWAPDGQSIVVAALHDGEPRLTSIFLQGGAPTALLAEYSIDPVYSPDGRFLLYSGADIGMTFPLRAIGADGRPYSLRPLILARGARVAFGRRDREIIVLRGEISHKNFWTIDLDSGAERQLTQFGPGFNIQDFDLTADGKQIVFDRLEESSTIAVIDRESPR